RILRALGLARLLARWPGRFAFSVAMLASTRRPVAARDYRVPRAGEGGRVAVLSGCVMEGLFADTNRATERTLAVNGYARVDAPGQGCCGALHVHAGDADAARRLARANVAAFERSGTAINAAAPPASTTSSSPRRPTPCSSRSCASLARPTPSSWRPATPGA